MLQATDGVRVHLHKPDVLDQPDQHGRRHGLPELEQRPEPALLQLQLVQSWVARQYEERMEES